MLSFSQKHRHVFLLDYIIMMGVRRCAVAPRKPRPVRKHLSRSLIQDTWSDPEDIWLRNRFAHFFDSSSFTRPTSPVSRRTLMPCGWVGDFVRMSCTTPLVRMPLRWCCFCTICTSTPGLILLLSMPLILSFSRTLSLLAMLTNQSSDVSTPSQFLLNGGIPCMLGVRIEGDRIARSP